MVHLLTQASGHMMKDYLLKEDDINTAGWGNQELEYYTRDNVISKRWCIKYSYEKAVKGIYRKR